MIFDKSLIRVAHHFKYTFIGLMRTSEITRQQFIFMAYLIETGHTKGFLTRSVMIQGLSWELANQYLNKLKRIGYASKQKRLWTITDKGMAYYITFMQELNRIHKGPFFWK